MLKKTIYGVDVSKAKLDYSYFKNHWIDTVLGNTLAEIEAWVCTLNPKVDYIVLEHTGTYSNKLIEVLSKYDFTFSVVNPRRSNNYMNAIGMISKNDQSCARALAHMGQVMDLPVYQSKRGILKERWTYLFINPKEVF
ncbi:MAG: transposase [Saprospiraceae bacterium]